MDIQELITDIPKLLAFVICIVSLVQLFIIFFIDRKVIKEDLRGKDKMWQFLELSGVVWLVLFPVVVICSLLGLEVATGVWASMDVIYFMNLGGKLSNKWLDNKQTKSNKDEQI